MITRNPNFLKGKESLLTGDLESAEKHFREASRRDHYGPGTDYHFFTLLARSDFRKLAAAESEKNGSSDMSLYSLYHFRKLAGDLHEAENLLDKMSASRHYFLKIYAAKELYLKNRLPVDDILEILSSGLLYEMPFEEERASLYLSLMRRDRDKALESSLVLLNRYPWLPDVILDRMEVLEYFDEKKALRDFMDTPLVRKLREQDHRIMAFTARFFYKTGDLGRASGYLESLSQYFRNNPLYHFHIANIHLSRNELVKAIQCFEEALALAPLFERACYNTGICYYRLGEIEKASACFERAISIRKKADSVFNLTVCMVEKKHFKEAYFNLNRVPEESRIPAFMVQEQIKQLLSYT